MVYAAGCLALATVACERPPDYISHAGVSYRWHGAEFDVGQIEAQESWFTSQIEVTLHYNTHMVTYGQFAAEVTVYPAPVHCLGPSSGLCHGVEMGGAISVQDEGTVAQSALTHEEAHWIREQVLGDADAAHLDTALWAIANGHP